MVRLSEVEANSSKKSALISEFFSEDLREKAGRWETEGERSLESDGSTPLITGVE